MRWELSRLAGALVYIYFYLGESGGKLEYLNFDEILKFLQNEIYILELELLELNN